MGLSSGHDGYSRITISTEDHLTSLRGKDIIQRDDTDNTYEDWIYFSSEAQVHRVFRVALSSRKISDIFEESPDRYP